MGNPTPAVSVLWLEAGSGNAPASLAEQYCFGCGKFVLVVNAVCADCLEGWNRDQAAFRSHESWPSCSPADD